MTRQEMNNRANQLNPNNELYWKSRGYKSSNNKHKKNNQNHNSNIGGRNRVEGNQGYACRICGKRGKLTFGGLFCGVTTVFCGYCNGYFDIRV